MVDDPRLSLAQRLPRLRSPRAPLAPAASRSTGG